MKRYKIFISLLVSSSPMECINCHTDQVRKNGKLPSGAQRYKCLPCNEYFSLGGKYDTYPEEFKKQVVETYKHLGSSARQVAKQFDISLSTLVEWTRHHRQDCKQCKQG